MRVEIDINTVEGYRLFLRVKSLPVFRFFGRVAWFPDEYASIVGCGELTQPSTAYAPHNRLFDYQCDISRLAIRKRKFAVFASCGLGKTLIMLEWCRHASQSLPPSRRVLIVSPLMVISQTIREAKAFYGESFRIVQVRARDLPAWLASPGDGSIGITNYESITESITNPGHLGALALHQSQAL
jgi:hypothetical protein